MATNDGSPQPNDLLVAAPDGNIYWVKEDVWKQTLLPANQSGQAVNLVQQGVVLADITPDTQPGIGCACYLVNIASITSPTTK